MDVSKEGSVQQPETYKGGSYRPVNKDLTIGIYTLPVTPKSEGFEQLVFLEGPRGTMLKRTLSLKKKSDGDYEEVGRQDVGGDGKFEWDGVTNEESSFSKKLTFTPYKDQ